MRSVTLSGLALFGLVALVGCGDKDEPGGDSGDPIGDGGGVGSDGSDGTDGTDGSDGGDPECLTNNTFELTGTVLWEGAPAEGAEVHVWEDGTDGWATYTTDVDGVYTATLDVAEYWVEINYRGCYGVYEMVEGAEACDVRMVDADIGPEDCDVAEKPNLYLYPESDTEAEVALEIDRRQAIVAADPPLQPGLRWTGTAHTDGTFSVREGAGWSRAPFLFYEVSLLPWHSDGLQREQGWCVTGSIEQAAAEMAELLGRYGFNAQERDDFYEGWRLDLPPAQAWAVYPQLEVDHIAGISMSLDLPVDRLWFLVEDGAGCPVVEEPVVLPFDRSGPHAVEWGVVVHDLAL